MTRQLGRRRRPLRSPAAKLARWNSENDRGATATEYAILAGFIAVVLGVAIAFFGDSLSSYYSSIASSIGSYL